MIYMWVPMTYWVPQLSYAFVVYFGLETIAWLRRAYIKPGPGNAVAAAGGSVVIPLAPRSFFGDICMTIMAASMGYMFAGMQLMMSMPRQSQQLALQQQPAPSQGVSNSGHSESGVPSLAQAPKVVTNEPARPSAETSPPALTESYTIVAGEFSAWYRRPALWRRAPVAQHCQSEPRPRSSPVTPRPGDQIASAGPKK